MGERNRSGVSTCMSNTKKKPGPPPIELDELQIAQVEALSAYLTIDKIADYFRIDQRTFYRLKNRDKRILSAYKGGVSKTHAHIGNTLMQFTQYTGDDACKLQLKFQAAKFLAQIKGACTDKEEKNLMVDISDKLTPLNIINKTIGEIRKGSLTLDEIKQLTELAQAKQKLLNVEPEEKATGDVFEFTTDENAKKN